MKKQIGQQWADNAFLVVFLFLLSILMLIWFEPVLPADISGSLLFFCYFLHIPKCHPVGSLMLYKLRLRC